MSSRTILQAVAAATLSLTLACASSGEDPNRNTKRGAAIGAAVGAAAGAVVGEQNDEAGEGAVIGAAVGAAVGAAIGARRDRMAREIEEIENVEVQTDPEREDALKVTVADQVLFDFDSASLRPSARPVLEDVADVLVRYPEAVVSVVGHTDAIGSESYNQRLSERRAATVTAYLASQGISAERIVAMGMGESAPIATNETPEGRQLNRRVELDVRLTS